MEKIVTMIPTNLLLQFSYKIAFISFLFSLPKADRYDYTF